MAEPTKQPLVSVSPGNLHVGTVLRFTLRDESGRVLLAKGHRIEDQHALDYLQKRRNVFVEYEESDEAVKVLMSGLSEVDRRGAAIKDIDRYSHFENADTPAPAESLPTSMSEAWSVVEARLRALLHNLTKGGTVATETVSRLSQQVSTVQDTLLRKDRDASLFLLLHSAVTVFSGYSALHSLVTATVAHLLAEPLKLTPAEDQALTCAALTMNVAMTSLQDALATQKQRPTPVQQTQIDRHPAEGVRLLQAAGVTDKLWLGTVFKHHADLPAGVPLAQRPPMEKLARILQVVDRYTAAMSPRIARAGRDAKDAARSAIIQPGATGHDEVGLALMMTLGLHPAGTYVKLANGETAVVLRKGAKPNEPWVASVLNKRDEPIAEPRLYNTAKPEYAVTQGLSGTGIRVRLNSDIMLRQLAFSKTGAERGLGLR